MNFPDQLFSSPWTLLGNSLFLAALVAAVWLAPWRRLADSAQFNAWLGSVVTLCLVWSMKAGMQPGLNLHLLGATVLTLMFGRSLAMLALALVLAAVTFNSGGSWQHVGLAGLVTIVFPVLVSEFLRRATDRYLPANFFVYVFVAAFFGAALTVVATGGLSTLLLWGAGIYSLDKLLNDYLPYFLLLGFAEAWLSGAVITVMVVYLPHWVGSFDDRHYLWKK
ncbi:energy-coupling factor ABC transporter permease [Denitratisoma sp. agr-D3]